MGRHYKVLRVLLEAGAKPDSLDDYGSTPLYMASRQLSPECVQVRMGAAFHHVSCWHMSGCSLAGAALPSASHLHALTWLRCNRPQVLLELGGTRAGVDKVNAEDETPMMAALLVTEGDRRRVRLELERPPAGAGGGATGGGGAGGSVSWLDAARRNSSG